LNVSSQLGNSALHHLRSLNRVRGFAGVKAGMSPVLTAVCVNCQMFAVLNDEIRRLSRVMEEFDRPFDADPATLQLYKKVIRLHCIYVVQRCRLLLQTLCVSACWAQPYAVLKRLNQDSVLVMDSGGLKEPCIKWRPGSHPLAWGGCGESPGPL